MIVVTSSFSKSFVFKMLYEKPAFSNSSGLKGVSEKLRFRDGLVWTVGLTVEIKLSFQILQHGVDGALGFICLHFKSLNLLQKIWCGSELL